MSLLSVPFFSNGERQSRSFIARAERIHVLPWTGISSLSVSIQGIDHSSSDKHRDLSASPLMTLFSTTSSIDAITIFSPRVSTLSVLSLSRSKLQIARLPSLKKTILFRVCVCVCLEREEKRRCCVNVGSDATKRTHCDVDDQSLVVHFPSHPA